MTCQSSLPKAGFRELSPHELEAISGGTQGITVTASRGGITVTGSRGGFGFDFGGGGGLSHDSGGAYDVDYGNEDYLIDDDGDGQFDEILVERTKVTFVDPSFYGFFNDVNNTFDIYRNDISWFWEMFGWEDGYLGRYIAADPSNASLTITQPSTSRESGNNLGVTIMGNGGETGQSSSSSFTTGNTQYFTHAP